MRHFFFFEKALVFNLKIFVNIDSPKLHMMVIGEDEKVNS